MKLGFLGGGFDPVHLGHCAVAEDVFEQLKLEKLFFVPAHQPPLKGRTLAATAAQRLAMLQLAIGGDARFAIRDDELKRGGDSYTIDSANAFQAEFPDAEIFWIIGADQLAQLACWHRIDELVQYVTFACVERPGFSRVEPPAIEGLRVEFVRTRLHAISSSEIRELRAKGRSINNLVPPAVNNYIVSNRLYESPHEHP